jgi:HD-like signal output (HDOD) protein
VEISVLSSKGQQIAALLAAQIEKKEIDVPMLPEVAHKALRLTQDPDSTATAMANLIQSDQSLAAHVMRIANSVAYTPLANLVSLQQAVARLGMGAMSEIALAASVGAKLFNTPGYEAYIAQQWQHALATGLWAKEIARQTRSNVEVAFLAGLLHSIGRPAVLQTILDLAELHEIALSEQEISELESSYQHATSEMVVNSWEMPSLVTAAIAHYPNYENAPVASKQAAQINLAILYASHMLDPDQIEESELLTSPALTILNIYQDEAEALLAKSESVAEKCQELSA